MRQRGDLPRSLALIAGLTLSGALLPRAADAQRAVDLHVGSWTVEGPNPTLFSAGLWRHLAGPSDFGVRGFAVVDADSGQGSLFGLGPQIGLFRGGEKITPYGVAGAGLAMRTGGSSELVAVWDAGLGMELSPVTWLGLAVEVTRFVEDEGFRGFWNLDEADRRGWTLSARVSVSWGNRARSAPGRARPPPARLPEPMPIASEPAEPLSAAGYTTAGQVVATAVDAMGEPYRWGWTSTDEGFDCSGLIWYAYRSHGIELPRVSRNQARSGRPVARDITALEPGDILLFADRASRVSHVGLYIGNARFIHATTSGGVRISSLSPYDEAYDRWWLERWVGARRILR